MRMRTQGIFLIETLVKWRHKYFDCSELSWETLNKLWQQKLVVPHGKIQTFQVISKHFAQSFWLWKCIKNL